MIVYSKENMLAGKITNLIEFNIRFTQILNPIRGKKIHAKMKNSVRKNMSP